MGTLFIGFFDVKINNNDDLMIIASVDDPLINSTVDRAIVIVGGDAGGQTVMAKEGDVLAGQTESVEDFGTGPHESAFNDLGSVLYVAELTGDTASDQAIYLNSDVDRSGRIGFAGYGRDYEFLASRGNRSKQ